MASPQIDGRRRRSERSRVAIVQALLDLIGEKILEPTAQQVAERAGVDITTVFRHFSDMETLYRAMSDQLMEVMWPLAVEGGPDPGAPLDARVRDFAARRAAFFERVSPYEQASVAPRQRSPVLREQRQLAIRSLRADMLRWLPEVRQAGPDRVEAIDLASSFEAWDRLRSGQRLGRARAQSAMETMLMVLVQGLA